MSTNLLTIDNMLFAGTTLTPNPVANPNPFPNPSQFSTTTDTSNTIEPNTTDNIYDIEQNKPVNEVGQDFNQTLRKAVKNQSPKQNLQNNNKVNKNQEEQIPTSEVSSKKEQAQSESTQEAPFTQEILIKENTVKVEPKTSSQIAQLLANLKDGKPQNNNKLQKDANSNLVTEQTEKSTDTKINITTDKKQLVSENIITISSKEQNKPQEVLSKTPKNTPTTYKQSEKIQNDDAISNQTIINTKNIVKDQTTKETFPDTSIDDNDNKSTDNEKLLILENDIGNDKNESPILNSKQLITDTIKVDDSKTEKQDSALTEKPVIETNEKTSVSNTSFSETQVQNKTTEQNTQSDKITSEKSVPNPNKTSITTDRKATEPEIPSESSNNKSKETLNSENNLSNNDTAKELNILDVQISTGQTKNNDATNNVNSELEQVLTQNNPQISDAQQPSGSADSAKVIDIPNQPSPGTSTTDVGKQVIESIQSSFSQEQRNQQITIQLNPPELGKVSIKFQEQDNQITGLLEVSKTQTRIEVEQAIPEIIRNLQDSGIQIKRLDVVLSQEQEEKPGQEALQDQTMQNSRNQHQQESADYYTEDNYPKANEINEWLINNNKYRNNSEIYESLTTNDSINMLV
jgi:flagellar hook-length control protein FliK